MITHLARPHAGDFDIRSLSNETGVNAICSRKEGLCPHYGQPLGIGFGHGCQLVLVVSSRLEHHGPRTIPLVIVGSPGSAQSEGRKCHLRPAILLHQQLPDDSKDENMDGGC
ncbi:hypothetical protein NMY22_g1372 [Coprinellus aureogranulatus]|nr:hypothetical protein NMY22_g1372 [Coprinellus aureogranulatus]